MGRRGPLCFLALLSVLASACAGHKGVSTGVLTGAVHACAGPAHVVTAHLQVYRGDALIATRAVPDDSTYRFVLPPGQYYVTNTGNRERWGWAVLRP